MAANPTNTDPDAVPAAAGKTATTAPPPPHYYVPKTEDNTGASQDNPNAG